LRPYLPPATLARIVVAQGDSAAGALRLIQQRLKE
jgi:glucosamine kinase